MDIYKQIQYYRKQAGLTQEELADKIYCSRNSVSNWERGKTYPDVEALLRMSELFETTIDHLVKGDLTEMKKDLNLTRINRWGIVMTLAFSLLVLMLLPSFHFFDNYAFTVLIPLGLIGIYAGYRIEIYKKQIKQNNHLKTLEEIIQYVEREDGHTATSTKPFNSRLMTAMYGVVFLPSSSYLFLSFCHRVKSP
ncbi:helix-turn-helix domain-containing protein [Gracilibacillus phocaeensis]|uniref:helix-turn-helix domain-containing protein n=1 Tax=Gracilibacillus phocaeensis TaxID=2042304 RepID=UPI00102FAB8C|nr:helix-turn-helix transcriptional regulator [Gracilibacillus phocaeensis]